MPIGRLNQQQGALTVQPAWTDFTQQGDVKRGYIGCSLALDLPEQTGLSSSLYLLFSGSGGQPIALLDGMRLTVWRTAGLHALGASYLSAKTRPACWSSATTRDCPGWCAAMRRAQPDVDPSGRRVAGNPKKDRRLARAQGGQCRHHERDLCAQEGADMICIAGPENETGTHHASPTWILLRAVT
ncbi:hypothetical protein [Roseibium aggregatum]|uniref:hypothetical protein n=1 Tax=Roseibium aggregatum TaxID=187304 RepID=UPI001E4EB22D|nr:hypothetical protein [Roseibium aggregatum]